MDGRPGGGGAGGPAEIIAGIRGDIREYTWREQPRLWHYLQSGDAGDAGQDGGNVSLKAHLAAAVGDQEARLELLLKGFGAALCAMLHMKPEELDGNMPAASLGIGSLVAVRIKEGFTHQVGVEVPVPKVTSANTSSVELRKDVLAGWRKQIQALFRTSTLNEPAFCLSLSPSFLAFLFFFPCVHSVLQPRHSDFRRMP